MENKEIINDSKTEKTIIPWWVVVAFWCFLTKIVCTIIKSDRDDGNLKEIKENLEEVKENLEEVKENLEEIKDDTRSIRYHVS